MFGDWLEAVTGRLIFDLITVASLLVFLDLTTNTFQILPVGALEQSFNMAAESSLSTWYSSFLGLLLATTSFGIHWVLTGKNDARRPATAWLYFSLFFLYLSIDDVAELHERGGELVGDSLEGVSQFSTILAAYPSYYWQITWGPVIGLLILWYAWYVLDQPIPRKPKFYLFVGLFCLVAAFSLDVIEGIQGVEERYVRWALSRNWDPYWATHTPRLLEEYLEMLGLILLLLPSIKVFELQLSDRQTDQPSR